MYIIYIYINNTADMFIIIYTYVIYITIGVKVMLNITKATCRC